MIVKYRTNNFSTKIIKKEITRETEDYVFFISGYLNGNIKETKELKKSNYQNWHNSFEEARKFLIKKIINKLKSLNKQISNASQDLLEVERLIEDEK